MHYGGIERIVDSLARELQSRGHCVGLVAHVDSTCPVEKLYPWPCLHPQSAMAHIRNQVLLARAVGDFHADLVHSFSRLGYLLPLLPMQIPKVMSYQRFTGGRQIHWGARLSRGTLHFTGCSQFIVNMGARSGGVWNVVPNFIDLAKFNFQATVSPDAPLVFLSRVERIKGAHTAISIAKRVGIRLIIAGNRAESGLEAEYWQHEIEPELDNDRISYIGPVDDHKKNELLGSAVALLVPIEWDEPFGIVFSEALACGTPVIATPRGALPEIVRPGIEGFLISCEAEGCRAVERLSEISREACRRRVEERFSSKIVTDQYIALYHQMVAGNDK
jgi:glycosyltransferase involved in cell wall biosynthesis